MPFVTIMLHNNPARSLFLICLLFPVLSILFTTTAVLADEGEPKKFTTVYATVEYPSDEVLLELLRKIGRKSFYFNTDPKRVKKLLGESVEELVFRVKTILDMFPAQFYVNMRIYATRDELKAVHRNMDLPGRVPLAFYIHRPRAIFLSVDEVNAGILAHEIAHGVINAYFVVRPSPKMQEILAQYVDKHLWDD